MLALADRVKAGDVRAETHHVLDQGGGKVRPLRARRDEERLEARHLVVHLCHLQLVVEVRYRAKAFHDDADLASGRIVHEQARERVHLGVLEVSHGLLQHRHPLVDAEEGRLHRVLQDRDHHPVETAIGPADDVDMPVRYRVERSRTQRR